MEFVSVNKFTLLDYPEKVACVLYTQACNFQCPYCHNWSGHLWRRTNSYERPSRKDQKD